jgi:hypothetical protein
VDLNADHLACCVLDSSGNPVGEPISIDVVTHGLVSSHRDGRLRAAITALLDLAAHADCRAIVIENLISPTRGRLDEKHLAAVSPENGCAEP